MDRFLRGHFRQAAENKYLKLRRTEFQAWFGNIMGKAHPQHYENIRLTKGDGGLDGIRVDTAFAYAVYAPRETTKGKLEDKIDSDFREGLRTLKERGVDMKGWVFVHNDEGLTKELGPALMKLRQNNPKVDIQFWTFEGIWTQLEPLSVDQLTDLFGHGPTEENVNQLEMPQIREVIEYLAREVPPPLPSVSSPDPGKLDFNKLSDENTNLMNVGERRSGLVGKYLRGMTDVTAGEAIAEAFRRKYAASKVAGMTADQIFGTLWRFAGGDHFTEPAQIAAVGAVISYYFYSCDIFENAPPPDKTST